MYKDTTLSEQNNIFDYYRVLKPHLPDKIAVKNLRVRNKKHKTQFSFTNNIKNDEPIIVSFN